MNDLVQVVIVVQNQKNRLLKICRMLSKQTVPVSKVILVVTPDTKGSFQKETLPKELSYEIVESLTEDSNACQDLGIQHTNSEFVLFLNENAVPKNQGLIENMMSAFHDEKTVLVLGRKSFSKKASSGSRAYQNYWNPAFSQDANEDNLFKKGYSAFFVKNDVAMYRKSALERFGTFEPNGVIPTESIWAADVLYAGMNLHYEASAVVIFNEEVKAFRSLKTEFDLGMIQKMYAQKFGLEQEYRYGKVESYDYSVIVRAMHDIYKDEFKVAVRYSCKHGRFYLVPWMCIRFFNQRLGHALGRRYHRIPLFLCKLLSNKKEFWEI